MSNSILSSEVPPEIVAAIGLALLLEQQESCGPHGQISACSPISGKSEADTLESDSLLFQTDELGD